MPISNETDDSKAQARFAKGRNWAKHPGQRTFVQNLFPVFITSELHKTKHNVQELAQQKGELAKQLESIDKWIDDTEHLLTELQSVIEDHREKHLISSMRIDNIRSICGTAETNLNTLQNTVDRVQSIIESKVKSLHNRLTGLEDKIQQNALVHERKSEIAKLLELLNSEGKLGFLRSAFEEHPTAVDDTINPGAPPSSSSINCGGQLEELSQLPPSLEKFMRRWNHWNASYSNNQPKHECKFIVSFLTSFRPEIASMLQRAIIRAHPTTRKQHHAPQGRFHVKLFIDLTFLSWPDVDSALYMLDFDALGKAWDMEERSALKKR